MNKLLTTSLIALTSQAALAGAAPALSMPAYFGSINNNSGYVIECSQVVGGYCANNPMPANGYIQMLPDPGSKQISGHIMAFDKGVPGKYTDNLFFTYAEQKDGTWKFQITSAYKHISVKAYSPDIVVLNRSTTK